MERPKKADSQGKYIVQLRLSLEEYEMLRLLANEKGLKLSSYLRMTIREKHGKLTDTQKIGTEIAAPLEQNDKRKE